MIIKRFTSYADDSTIRLPLDRLGPRLLGSLDAFLDGIDRDFPEALEIAADRLKAHIGRESPEGEPTHAAPVRLTESSTGRCERRFPEATLAHRRLICRLLGVDEETLLHGEEVKLSQRRFIRARYVPKYLMLLALSEAIGRERSIVWMKAHLDGAVAGLPIRDDAPETLEQLRETQTEFNLVEQGMNWVQAVVDPHQYLNKVTRCRIHEVLSAYDAELMEVVACYPDFAMFRHTNPSFILTRTQTLMNGGTCCDSCYHDDRYVESFVHPSSVFGELQ